MEEEVGLATGPSYRVAYRRRREGKTDYQMRRALVLSGIPRLVVRGSLRNTTAQLVTPEVNGDRVVTSASSGELAKKYGWLGNTGNLSAAYLTGLMCGLKASGQGVKEVVLDIGLNYPSKGARIFAVLKGAVDGGLTVNFDKEKLPDQKRMNGEHIAEYARKLASAPEAYQKQYSGVLAKGLKPEEMGDHVKQVKEKIILALKKAGSQPEKAEAESESGEDEESEESEEEEFEEEE